MDSGKRIKELEVLLDGWNHEYRFEGHSTVPDSIYDEHLEELAELDPENSRVTKVGETPIDNERKENLPIIMASMNKVKSYEELKDWAKKKNIPADAAFCISPKYDGLSILNDVRSDSTGWTRGDGAIGQNSTPHLKDVLKKYSKNKIENFLLSTTHLKFMYTTGEAIISNELFQKNHASDFDNVRNRVAGLFNKYKPENREALNDVSYMRYGLHVGVEVNKSTQLEFLNEYFNSPKVPFVVIKMENMSTEYLKELFLEWSKEFSIDGLIIEVNDAELRSRIAPERSTKENPLVMNPGYARAYKASFEEQKESVVVNIQYEVSKMGNVIPVAEVEPTVLDGAEVTHVTCNNAKMVKGLGIGKGAIVRLKRSGMVIPFIVSVVKKSNDEFMIPTNCPSCNTELIWNDTDTHLMCTNPNCPDRNIKQITSFFDILGVKGVRESTFRQLYNAGYNTIGKIISMSISDFREIDRMGDSKSSNTYDAIQSKLKNITLCKLQHASGFFTDQKAGYSLGSKKLALLEHFTEKPTIDDVKQIDGFSDSSAELYVENYEKFFKWYEILPIKVGKEEAIEVVGNSCVGKTFIFTGVRREDLEIEIKKQGGIVTDNMSKKCTHLIMKSIGSGTSKETKAKEYGMTIWTVVELVKFLKL